MNFSRSLQLIAQLMNEWILLGLIWILLYWPRIKSAGSQLHALTTYPTHHHAKRKVRKLSRTTLRSSTDHTKGFSLLSVAAEVKCEVREDGREGNGERALAPQYPQVPLQFCFLPRITEMTQDS